MRQTTVAVSLALAIFAINAGSADAAERFWFNSIGVEFGITGVLQQTSGNEFGDSVDQTDYAYSADFALVGKIAEGQTLNLVFEAGGGEAVADNFDARATPDYDAADSGHAAEVAQAYYEGEFADGKLVFAFGRMDAHSITDANEYANDETSQFLNGIFVRSVGTIFAEHDKYYVPTIALSFQPAEIVSVVYTYSHNSGEDMFNEAHQWIELGLHPKMGSMAANLRIGYAMHDVPHTEIDGGAETTNSGMINVSADLALSEVLGVFARYAMTDDSIEENEVTSVISGGVSIGGGLWGREDDGIGAAYGMISLNEKLYDNTDGETVMEFYYRFQVNDYFAVSADLQMFSDLERDEEPDVMVYGLRTQAGF